MQYPDKFDFTKIVQRHVIALFVLLLL